MGDEQMRDALFAALDSDRGDRSALGALADWYEEHGEADDAACLHWAVNLGRRPGFNEAAADLRPIFLGAGREAPHPQRPAGAATRIAVVGPGGQRRAPSGRQFQVGYWQTVRAAFLALLAGWKRGGAPADLICKSNSKNRLEVGHAQPESIEHDQNGRDIDDAEGIRQDLAAVASQPAAEVVEAARRSPARMCSELLRFDRGFHRSVGPASYCCLAAWYGSGRQLPPLR